MKKVLILAIVGLMLVGAAGCTPGPNPLADSPRDRGDIAGFWTGLWQGFIVLFTFIISLFTDNVRPYEVHNNGNWYNFGFLLGVMIFFGGGGGGACKGKRRK
jgi:hypothetical protein